MDTDTKLDRLDSLYRLYDETVARLPAACAPGCAHCCTRNVIVTTLEGWRLVDRLDAGSLERLHHRLEGAAERPRFRPRITVNRLAELAMTDEEPPEEACDPAWSPCPLLADDLCPVYDLRPFACRCMFSTVVCGPGGYAAQDDYLITANTVFQPVIEHLDVPGGTGNLVDVLQYLRGAEQCSLYRTGMIRPEAAGLPANRPVRMLMLPPEHRERLQPVVGRIQKLLGG